MDAQIDISRTTTNGGWIMNECHVDIASSSGGGQLYEIGCPSRTMLNTTVSTTRQPRESINMYDTAVVAVNKIVSPHQRSIVSPRE
jgi:hypothetical protein